MKSITKKIAIILLVCMLTVAVVSLVACKDKSDPNVYTVTVVDEDGNPYAKAIVQLCKIEADGSQSTCYTGVATDANGVVKLEKEIPEDVNHVEVHLLGLPAYLTYERVKMHRGESVTVTVRLKKANELSSAKEGTGFGEYAKDLLTGEITSEIDSSTFKPYVVEEDEAYALKFTSATQKIYYEFHALQEGIYKVYSLGSVDASVTRLTGSKMTGIRNPGKSADFYSDNVSATDKNFSLEFVIEPELFEQTKGGDSSIDYAACYFEVALSNASDINKDAIIVFEYVDDFEEEPKTETVDVHPAKTLTVFDDQSGKYVDLEYDAKCVKGDDGYYHVDSKDGAIVIATLGNDEVTPKVLNLSFLNIFKQGQSLSFYDKDLDKNLNYAPLVEAYTLACNSEGRYPLTDELIEFFNVFIANASGGAGYFASQLHTTLPKGSEWIIWCGYYGEGSGDADEGTESNPFALEVGSLTVNVPVNGDIYYELNLKGESKTITVTSTATNISLKWYNVMAPAGAQTAQSGPGGFECTIELEAMNLYYFVFSTTDRLASTYSITVTEVSSEDEKGTELNPIEITDFDTYDNTVKAWDSVWYTFTTTEDITLYFAVHGNTFLRVSFMISEDVEVQKTIDELADGLTVKAGTVLRIELRTVDSDAGDVSFTISDSPID